jgi:hypothetical protein
VAAAPGDRCAGWVRVRTVLLREQRVHSATAGGWARSRGSALSPNFDWRREVKASRCAKRHPRPSARDTHTRPTHPARDTPNNATRTQHPKEKRTRQKYTKRCWRAAEPTANIPYPTPNLLFKHSNRARTCTRGRINP